MANFRTAGLLSGVGKGMSVVGDMMFQRERDEADVMRQKSLIELQRTWNVEDRDLARKQQLEDRTVDRQYKVQDRLRELKAEEDKFNREAGLLSKTVEAGGDVLGVNAYGEEIQNYGEDPGVINARTKAAAKGLDFDNPKHKAAMGEVWSNILRRHSDFVKSQGEENFDISAFTVKYADGSTGIDENMMATTLSPEMFQEWQDLKLLTERNITKGQMNPVEAARAAEKQLGLYKDAVKAQGDKQTVKKMATDYKVPEAVVKKTMSYKPTDTVAVNTMADEFMKNPTSRNAKLLKETNPETYRAVVKEIAARKKKEAGTTEPEKPVSKPRASWQDLEDQSMEQTAAQTTPKSELPPGGVRVGDMVNARNRKGF